MKLTIAIPTFDRNDILIGTLRVLLPQLVAGVEVLILDNLSPRPVEADIRASFDESLLTQVRFHRHKCNLGANANIVRCLEFANCGWVWLLGDDDLPYQGAVKKILADLDSSDESVSVLCYSSDKSGPCQDSLIDASDFPSLYSLISYGSMLFMSTKVVRVENAQHFLTAGYRGILCSAPHLAVMVSMLANGQSMQLLTYRLVVQTIPRSIENRWGFLEFASRCGLLVSAVGFNHKDAMGMLQWIRKDPMFPVFRLLAFVVIEGKTTKYRRQACSQIRKSLMTGFDTRSLVFSVFWPFAVYASPLVMFLLKMFYSDKARYVSSNRD